MHGPMANYHHLFRLRVLPTVWEKLGEIAAIETARRREFVSRSDVARVAIADWIQNFEASERLGAMRPPASESPTG